MDQQKVTRPVFVAHYRVDDVPVLPDKLIMLHVSCDGMNSSIALRFTLRKLADWMVKEEIADRELRIVQGYEVDSAVEQAGVLVTSVVRGTVPDAVLIMMLKEFGKPESRCRNAHDWSEWKPLGQFAVNEEARHCMKCTQSEIRAGAPAIQ